MAEQRLIDANALEATFLRLHMETDPLDNDWFTPYLVVKDAETVDAVPVVRCMDCKYKNIPKCCPFQINGFKVENDWYCPMGVKMDGGSK